MHIEVWKGSGKQPWRWHAVSKGRVTCASEGFPTKAHATRAVKALVRSVIRPLFDCTLIWLVSEKDGKTILRWA